MQIERAFRDLKSHRYGQGMEDSLTRRGDRLQILLLANALTAFASWLAGLGCEAAANPRCDSGVKPSSGIGRWSLRHNGWHDCDLYHHRYPVRWP